ncbi:MAG TPA: prolipoprotein diacylglyceryl transferase [Streptosporangiaceae bacterium]
MTPVPHPLAYIPSPPVNGFHIGPLFVHFYGLMYVIGITLAILITQRRVRNAGGDPSIVGDIAIWAVPAGIIGGRIYFDITTPADIPHVWYGPFAVWSGGLGIWGGIAAGALAGVWRIRRRGLPVAPIADAIAPALLVAQAVGRVGNYFNQELFGGPTTLPWGLVIGVHHRPPGYTAFRTFQPTFLYELIFDLALAALLVWLGHHTRVKPPGLFALYVTGYSAFRIFEESLRIDSSEHFLGLRLNLYVASILTLGGIIWFIIIQRRKPAPTPAEADGGEAGLTAEADTSGTDDASASASDKGGIDASSESAADVKSNTEATSHESVPDKTGRRA